MKRPDLENMKSKYACTNDCHRELIAYIEHLEALLAKGSAALETAKDGVDRDFHLMNMLRKELAEKDSAIASMDKRIDHLELIARANEVTRKNHLGIIAEKDKRIAQLDDESRAQRVRIAELEAEVKDARDNYKHCLADLTASIEGKNGRIAELEERISHQRHQIVDLRAELRAHD